MPRGMASFLRTQPRPRLRMKAPGKQLCGAAATDLCVWQIVLGHAAPQRGRRRGHAARGLGSGQLPGLPSMGRRPSVGASLLELWRAPLRCHNHTSTGAQAAMRCWLGLQQWVQGPGLVTALVGAGGSYGLASVLHHLHPIHFPRQQLSRMLVSTEPTCPPQPRDTSRAGPVPGQCRGGMQCARRTCIPPLEARGVAGQGRAKAQF